ncbi:MAG: 4Fe-4S binding protein [Candidatus Lokiarchaeota archaeon]|jgi:formate hydrogenlyase subunit 6/NADH:ubiquinone oxidoreductase subunit I
MYPRVKRIVDNQQIELVESFFTENYTIEINTEKCIGCGFCIRACPNQVISSPDLTSKIRIKTEDLKADILDVTKCSFCGTCQYICPLSAITLKKNEEVLDSNEMGIITRNVVPKLKFDTLKIKKGKDKIKKHFIGKIEVDWDKCISCMSCVGVCPVNAFKRNKSDDKTKKVLFEEEKCIGCGTCARACNVEAITYDFSGLNFSGKYKEIFWNALIERLKSH